ncbi:MAG: magnesium chelatase [Desulfuromonas sp.]|nr:MAG: magnesium chelatase [Desulfuromonas sp.]
MRQPIIPFSALLGQETMQAALLVNAVDPGIGGVLIRGQKGTGKSTAARALASLLPPLEVIPGCPYHCPPDAPEQMHDGCRDRFDAGETFAPAKLPTPFIDLPLSASEDRLVGTLHLGKTLETGERHFEPGLLAAANRGILYVDEVNLLPDHLVDLLLDAAVSGINLVEREGMQVSHPARFLLVGTMNPEEGDLRPQFLDRFALCVEVAGLQDPDLRREVVLRRLAFDQDPASFQETWQEQELGLAQQLITARRQLQAVAIPEEVLDQAVTLTTAARVQGHRADLALIRTARALAALLDRPAIGPMELAEAARLVLPHRLERSVASGSESLGAQITSLLETHLSLENDPGGPEEIAPDTLYYMDEDIEFPGSAAAGVSLFTHLKKKRLSAPSPLQKPST